MRAVFVALGLLAATPLPAAAQDVLVQLQNGIDLVSAAVERSFARALPLPAPSAGVSYSFDPATGNFRREPATYGQVYLERADPLGARRFNVSFVYQYVELAEIDGHDAANLHNAAPIPIEGLLAAFDLPRFNIGAQVHQFLFAGTYGIGDDVEASIAVPVVYSDLSAMMLQPDGNLILAGRSMQSTESPIVDLGVMRLLNGGEPDDRIFASGFDP